MFRKRFLIGAAACAALTCAGLARADSSVADITAQLGPNVVLLDNTTMPASTAPAPTAQAATAPSAPTLALTTLLGNIPHYTDTGLNVTGYVEGSWTYSAHPPIGNILYDRSFDTKTESLQFDAIDLSISRTADYTKKAFDFGFAVEGMYGWDADYIHSNGLNFYSAGHTASGAVPGAGGTATIHPKMQVDIVQANFTVIAPVGHGIGIEGGKFDTLVGYEVIDAPTNAFFSHSYIFFNEPYTHTGLLGIYNLCDPSDPDKSCKVTVGFSRGWDQSTNDDNGSEDIMGQVNFVATNKYSVVFSFITGDETPNPAHLPVSAGLPEGDGWRTLFDLNGTYTVSDQITLGYNAMYAFQNQDGGWNQTAIGPVQDTGIGQWYGLALYGQWKPCDYVAFNMRAEWFDDPDGAAPGDTSPNPAAPTASGLASGPIGSNNSNQYYEVTLGLTFKPLADDKYFSGLALRPEVRWDYANHAAFNNNTAGLPTQNSQWTVGVEAYFAF